MSSWCIPWLHRMWPCAAMVRTTWGCSTTWSPQRQNTTLTRCSRSTVSSRRVSAGFGPSSKVRLTTLPCPRAVSMMSAVARGACAYAVPLASPITPNTAVACTSRRSMRPVRIMCLYLCRSLWGVTTQVSCALAALLGRPPGAAAAGPPPAAPQSRTSLLPARFAAVNDFRKCIGTWKCLESSDQNGGDRLAPGMGKPDPPPCYLPTRRLRDARQDVRRTGEDQIGLDRCGTPSSAGSSRRRGWPGPPAGW